MSKTDVYAAIGVIGGSGLYQMEGLEDIQEVHLSTPYGDPSDSIVVGKIVDVPVAFLPRHGRGHIHTPTEVPYRANIYALKSLGVTQIISISACGSLRESLKPGHIVVPDQLFDFTKDRERSFFGDGLVAHISVPDPFCNELSTFIADATEAEGGIVHRGGTFITIEGPRFSTKAESHVFRAWGMDIIGMTASPEAYLAREAGICYSTMAHVTDYDVWHESEEPVTVEMIITQLLANLELAQNVIKRLIPQLNARAKTCTCVHALNSALITDPNRVPPETQERVRLLTGK
ncbi:MAG: S-methyl-5'-thioadenosine phosphorylase [Anaerolineae bacterium]|nr:S-methyl-5'-thioadenosine phosphorylase [Anaerolineae bacterium]